LLIGPDIGGINGRCSQRKMRSPSVGTNACFYGAYGYPAYYGYDDGYYGGCGYGGYGYRGY
jgi:hypothetical protein